jgi:hypothetical protein
MKLQLNEEQVNLILQALAQLPYVQSAGLIQEIINQAQKEKEAKKNAEQNSKQD